MASMTWAGNELPGLEINFRDDLTEQQRQTAELSVAALVKRWTDNTAQRRAAEAERAKVEAAVNTPLIRMIQEDPVAARALEAANDQHLVEDLAQLRGFDLPQIPAPNTVEIELRGEFAEIFAIPYHFQWSWHNTAGGPPFNLVIDHPNGRLGIDSRTGAELGGAEDFVDAHAGFGIILTTPREVTAIGRSLRRMRWHYTVGAGLGGDATSEGGVEFGVLENGNLIAAAADKRWRKRVSGTVTNPVESAIASSDGEEAGEPGLELSWTMRPGNEYTFNVGAWAFCERHPGIGGGTGGQGLIQGQVIMMSIFR